MAEEKKVTDAEKRKEDIRKFYLDIDLYLEALDRNCPPFFKNYNILLFSIFLGVAVFAIALEWAMPNVNGLIKLALAAVMLFLLDRNFIELPWRKLEASAIADAKSAIDRKEEPAIKDLVILKNTINKPHQHYGFLSQERDYLDSGYLRLRMKLKRSV